jgi:hypothetical protein
MSGKIERLPRWSLKRMTVEQRAAYDVLRWQSPVPAERARLKLVLGWKRTYEETVALATELRAQGLMDSAIADELRIGDRYLRRLLKTGVHPSENVPANPHQQRAEVAPTGESDTGIQVAGRTAPIDGFPSLADLDAWLRETA